MGAGKFWTPVLQRLGAIVAGTYGTGRAVPAGTFAFAQFREDLDGSTSPDVDRERWCELVPVSSGFTLGDAANQHSGENARSLILEARLGYRYDTEAPLSGTTADEAVSAQLRALDDWDGTVLRALMWPDNWGAVGNVVLFNVQPAGRVDVRDDGAGRITLVAPLLVEVSFDPGTVFALGS